MYPQLLRFAAHLPRANPPSPSLASTHPATCHFPTMSYLLAAFVPIPDSTPPPDGMDNIVRQALGPLLLGSHATLCLYTFECLFMLCVSSALV